MTVYVDDMRRPANLTGRTARWSHLVADTHDQLMTAALDLGLRPEWLQHPDSHREHFDVTESVRRDAIARGLAQEISYPHGMAEVLEWKRTALQTGGLPVHAGHDGHDCLYCGRVNDAHAGPAPDQRPAAGDVSLCWGCGGVALFTDTGLRLPSLTERRELNNSPELKTAQAAIRESFTPEQASRLRWAGQ